MLLHAYVQTQLLANPIGADAKKLDAKLRPGVGFRLSIPPDFDGVGPALRQTLPQLPDELRMVGEPILNALWFCPISITSTTSSSQPSALVYFSMSPIFLYPAGLCFGFSNLLKSTVTAGWAGVPTGVSSGTNFVDTPQ